MLNKDSLIISIQNSFIAIDSNILLTLAEADYLDVYVRPFGFPCFPYDYSGDYIDQIKELEELSYWLDDDKVYAIKCINENLKMKNQYKDWREIPHKYLDWYYNGFSYIDNISFLFYTPAVMTKYLLLELDYSSTGLAIDWWYQRIKKDFMNDNLNNLFYHFNDIQLSIVLNFLMLYNKDFSDSLSAKICDSIIFIIEGKS